MPEHRVKFLKAFYFVPKFFSGYFYFLCKSPDLRRLMRKEFMKRRVQQPNRDRSTLHRLENPDEVVALVRQQLIECPAAGAFGVGDDSKATVGDGDVYRSGGRPREPQDDIVEFLFVVQLGRHNQRLLENLQ